MTVRPDGVVTIGDEASGSQARILTTVGFNCFSFTTTANGQAYDLIWAEEGFGEQSELSMHGIPVLFPFAGRIEHGAFTFDGADYTITGGVQAGPNAIHGFVFSRPWRVIAQSAAEVTGEFHASVDDPSLLTQWPSDFRIRATYRVEGQRLVLDVAIDNPGAGPLPFGFGTHPYFRLPFAAGQNPATAQIDINAAQYWVHENGLPTGEVIPVGDAQDFRGGKPFDHVAWDGVLTGSTVEADGFVHTRVTDPATGVTIDQAFPPHYSATVVWVPPHRETIAIEAWTAVPNAFALRDTVDETGLIVLAPGEQWTSSIVISLVD